MRIASKPPSRRSYLPLLVIALGAVLMLRVAALGEDQPPAGPAAGAASNASAAPAQAPDAEKSIPAISPIDLFHKAGFFIWPLVLCSVLAVALIIERFAALRYRRIIPPGFVTGLKQIYQDPTEDRDRALEYCAEHDSPLSRMVGAGIRRLSRGHTAAEKAIEDAGANETLKLRQNMRFLYSLGSVATLLGLIGTIWGMIKAFQVASVMGPGHAEKLSEGIYEAMVNTFAGLAIAIVVTIFYYYFAGRIEKLVVDMNDAVNDIGREIGFDSNPDEEAAITSRM